MASDGRFTYLEVIGEGTSGTVYRAIDPEGREVAVKLFRANVARDPAQLKRFRREVEIATELAHENLVRTYAGGQAVGGRLFISTELVPGGDLHRLLLREGRLPERAAVLIVRDILAALDYLDEKGLVHRDVKPGNVLIAPDGRALLSDFGLAKPAGGFAAGAMRAAAADQGGLDAHAAAALFGRITATGEVVGTPYYLAPEQILGARDVDVRADIYAAGVVLFELLSGRPPFDGPSVVEIAERHLSAPVPDIGALAPEVSPGTRALLAALLEKLRERRPPTPGDAARWAHSLLPDPARARSLVQAALERASTAAAAEMSTSAPGPAGPGAAGGITRRGGTLSSGQVFVRSRPLTARWRLDLLTERATLKLFVVEGSRLDLGRDSVDRSENDICLRVRGGGEGAETASKKISSRHFRLEVDEQGARITDLGSKVGTRVDGQKLVAMAPVPLRPLSTISVSGVLELEAHTLRSPTGGVEALLLYRPQNGSEHCYALVRQRIRIGVRAGAPAVGLPPATGADLFVQQGRFFLDGHPIDAGDVFETVGNLAVEVAEIVPEDMK